MSQEVEVTRTLLPAPNVENPQRKVYQIEYRVGMQPSHFVYLEESEYSEAKEKEAIKADINKRLEKKRNIITL